MKKKKVLLVIIPIVVFFAITFTLFLFFYNPPVLVQGTIDLDYCYNLQDNISIAYCLHSNNENFFLTYENGTLITSNDLEFSKWYNKEVIVSGPIETVYLLGDKCYLLKVMQINLA